MRKLLTALLCVLLATSCSYASYWNEGNYGYDEEYAFIIDSLSDFLELRDRVNNG